MHLRELTKVDGRRIWLYSRTPIHASEAPSFPAVELASHMRWHPLLQEWVIYAGHRQDRTFLPADDPLAPMTDPDRPTELPAGEYDVGVFENRFPSLAEHPGPAPQLEGVVTAPASGRTEVVVFSQQPTGLSELDDDRVALVLDVLAHRTRALAAQGMRYVLPFENRGVEMGVTLHHPHGQIYAYPFLPGQQARALYAQRQHYQQRGRSLVEDLVTSERAVSVRMVADAGDAVSLAPPFARFPYETWVLPGRPGVSALADLHESERLAFGRILKDALRRLDRLFARPMPYLMTFNQAPYSPCPEWTLRVEILPVRRSQDRLKYLAGTELGAAVFASDVTPENAAAALREAVA